MALNTPQLNIKRTCPGYAICFNIGFRNNLMLQLDHIFHVSFLVFLLVSFPAYMIFVEMNILKTL